jgi:MutS2 family protein
VINKHVFKTLEYEKVKEALKEYAISEAAKRKLEQLQPSVNISKIRALMQETTEARIIIDINSSVPLSALEDTETIMDKSDKAIVLSPLELNSIKDLLECSKKLRKFMDSMKTVAPTVAGYASSMFELPELQKDIEHCIINARVADGASPDLNRIRKRILIAEDRLKQKINSILSSASYSNMLRETVVSTRSGRYVIPVKREYKKKFAGNVLDISSSGSTLFIEPASIARVQEELNELKIAEEKEVFQILSGLTELVTACAREISINIETMVNYDFIFARAKYSQSLDCCPVEFNSANIIDIKGGRHPLLGDKAVPLDFQVGHDYRGLVITGPNTGGKTVALKTIGLLTLMVQSGLHVPAQANSNFAIFTDILADIGDGQSIEQSLSTFSAHVKNISSILNCSNEKSLILIDELGGGTDPVEGMGFAVAVLEKIYANSATVIATTHISQIKEFAEKTPGFENACMEFDIDSLKPLYKLSIGRPGESHAFKIALRLGVDRNIIERAHEISYKEHKEYSCGKELELQPLLDEEAIAAHSEAVCEMRDTANNEKIKEKGDKNKNKRFKQGDCVYISTMNRTGIVYEAENKKGEVVVMVMKKKYRINQKRLSLYVAAEDLYPEDYDLDIVFESKEDRKKRKQFSKRHIEGIIIDNPRKDG